MVAKIVLAVFAWGLFLAVAIYSTAAAVLYARIRGLA
jgi:hypothetical protein